MSTVRTFTVINELGLHARAATKLVQLVTQFPCEVEVGNGEHQVNAKSVMGLLLLCGGKGSTLTVSAKGERAEECVEAVGALIADRFGEGR